MTYEQFWYKDPELLDLYQRAYYDRLHEQAHTQGYYTFLGIGTALHNAFKMKGEKTLKYPEKPFDVFKRIDERKRYSKSNVELEYRQGLQTTMGWLNAMSNNQ